MVWNRRRRAFFYGSAIFLAAPHANAQPGPVSAESPPLADAASDKQVYTPADFSRFAPRTAMDMLNQVPGFTVRSDDQGRGLGQATENVLLNGERVPSKSGGAVSELERLPAEQVERIEIVNGSSLDIPGLSGQVANVITTTSRRASGQFAWNPEFRPVVGRPSPFRGEIGYSGTIGAINYSLGLEEYSALGGSEGTVIIADPTGMPTERRLEDIRSRQVSPEASARFGWKGPGSLVANAGVDYERDRRRDLETSVRERFDGVNSSRTVETHRKRSTLDFNGDLTVGAAGGRLKLIGLTKTRSTTQESSAITAPANGSAQTGDRIDSNERTQETIGRAEYDWSLGAANLQLAGEAAFNKLESSSRRFQLGSDNIFAEVPFVGGSGTVKEDRYELMGSVGVALSSVISVQLIAGAEHSTLSARDVSRTFLRPKGSLSLGWQPGGRADISAKFTRAVGQLDFSDFLASVDLKDDTENSGNINLVPPQSWEVDLEFNRSLGAWGRTALRVYGRLISNIVDTVPIGEDGESLGNIDQAKRYGVEWESTFQFEPLGWTGAKMDATVILQKSKVRDPLTGESREVSADLQREVELDLRHDLPGSHWAWGAALSRRWASPNFRLGQFSRSWDTPVDMSAFIEHKNVFGLTVRLEVGNIADRRNRFERTAFHGRRTDPIRFLESRKRRQGPVFALDVRGSF